MFCNRCGTALPDTAPACPRCGADFTATQPLTPAAGASAAPPPAWSGAAPARPSTPAQPYRGPQETDGKAVGSLVLGILAVTVFLFFTGIPAVILGHLSRKSIRQSLGRLKGDGMALAGLIMGYISIAVIPLILIIAAIAVPSLLRSKMLANESAATSTVRTLNTSQSTYSVMYPKAGYARDLSTLGPGPAARCSGEGSAEHACLIDGVLGNSRCTSSSWCTKYGYKFNITAAKCGPDGTCADYVVTATPAQAGTSGRRSFCSTSDSIIRQQSARSIYFPVTTADCQSWPPTL